MSRLDLRRHIDAALQWKPTEKLPPSLPHLQPRDLAEVIKQLPHGHQLHIIEPLPRVLAAKAISYLDPEVQYRILHHLPATDAAPLLKQMSSDSVADMLLALHPLQAETLLQLLATDYRQKIHALMTYPSSTAGGRATVDYIAARTSWTCEQTIQHLRKVGAEAETISYIYVTSAHGKLCGVVSLKEIILANPFTKLETMGHQNPINIPASMKQEAAASIFSHYDFYALPVVDPKGRLVGIITYDDIADVLREETTEDFQKLGGSRPLLHPYLQTSVFQLVRRRIPWLLTLFIGGSLTAKVLSHYELEINQHAVLSFFIALLTGTGGNTGSQIINTIVRALNVGEIRFQDLGRVIKKECTSGLLLGSSLAIMAYGLTYLLVHYQFGGDTRVLYIIPAATLAIVVWSSLVSSLLPLLIHRLRLDPAVVSGPLISTVVDATGLVIYFKLAQWFLRL
ncbi:magnesium transporter [Pasteuria penetrans]|uniref:magnesium transporter n=1 Tax=Pasteuria penetrans TaxID=86005 RepID=UPI000FB07AAB|nr:magnesium transporter [Pasteuria penetrans]